MSDDSLVFLKDLARDMRAVLLEIREVTRYMKEAESEVPEKMRRFMMYMHDVHDVTYMYEERGIPVPPHVLRELERVDDRYRHLVEDGLADAGWLEKLRGEMTKRPGNRWDHSKLLPRTEVKSETRTSEQQRTGESKDGTDAAGGSA